jgi:hypothetical protein
MICVAISAEFRSTSNRLIVLSGGEDRPVDYHQSVTPVTAILFGAALHQFCLLGSSSQRFTRRVSLYPLQNHLHCRYGSALHWPGWCVGA